MEDSLKNKRINEANSQQINELNVKYETADKEAQLKQSETENANQRFMIIMIS